MGGSCDHRKVMQDMSFTNQAVKTKEQDGLPMPKVKHCKICDKTGHTAFLCPSRAKKPLASSRRLKATGKHHLKWQRAKRAWFKANDYLLYTCYICKKVMKREETTLDHIKSRGRHPELRYELTNLAPCCWKCNGDKGSKDLEEL